MAPRSDNETSIFKRVSYTGDSGPNIWLANNFKAVYQAIRPGRTQVWISVNAEACFKSVAVPNGGWRTTIDEPGCTYAYSNWQSDRVTITVTE